MRLTCALLALALAACDEPSSGLPNIELPGAAVAYETFPLAWEQTGPGYDPAWDEPVRAVVRSAAEWDAAWATITGGHGVPPALPSIDFGEDMLLVVSLGMRTSGGYQLTVPEISDPGSGLTAAVLEARPGRGCVTSQALIFPVLGVKLARDEGPVTFVEYAYDRACD